MIYKNPIIILITVISLISVVYGLECDEGEVDLGWGDCNDWNSNHTERCMLSGWCQYGWTNR